MSAVETTFQTSLIFDEPAQTRFMKTGKKSENEKTDTEQKLSPQDGVFICAGGQKKRTS
ncbi:Hypothetical predicted protein [Xyrichtys novacula]|uniref:Uncharacterized protein n=1 Tax=Xyrichtys novacula TaxID=13765 RepID=A0AAV1H713_XYRNO|nr:Hypothetical predicted protein [Xyrichtys novacula]